MDIKANFKRLFLMYHDPCLDGVYSMFGMMLPILTKIRRDGWTIQEYMDYLEKNLQELNKEDKQINIIEKKYEQQLLNDQEFFSTYVKDLYYIPMKITQNTDEVQQAMKYIKDGSQSILMILDYFGRTWQNLQFLCKKFKTVIVIDHHQTCVNEFQQHPNYDYKKFKQLNKLDENLYCLINTDKAACELVQDFHQQLIDWNYCYQIPSNIGEIVQKFTKHIADNDLFILQYKETQPLQMAIMSLMLKYNARDNPQIIHQLVNLDFNKLLEIGEQLSKERDKKVLKIIQKRKTLYIKETRRNNKTEQEETVYAKGYAIECGDLSILNPLGHKMALWALKSGDHNVSAVYHEDPKNHQQFKVHLRSEHHDEKWNLLERYRCDKLAEYFGGGGHQGAACFYIAKNKWQKYLL